ncbi:MAG TPA: hypothetical protein VIV14_11005 [Gammaproteobacteria bacterium]
MDPRQTLQSRFFSVVLASIMLAACSTTPDRAADTAGVATTHVAPVDLSGEWIINYPLSDDPSEVLGDGTSPAESGFELAKNIGYSIGVYGISIGDIVDMLPRREEAQVVFPREITDAMDQLSVVQDQDAIEVDYDNISFVVYRNGEGPRETDSYESAVWRDGAFVVEREPREGLALSETFLLAPDGKQLIWIVSFAAPNGDRYEVTRVYDRHIAPPPPAKSASLVAQAASR